MAVLAMAQVNNVARIRIDIAVDEEWLATAPETDLLGALLHKAHPALNAMANPFGVDVDVRDLVCEWMDGPNFTKLARFHWWPSTNEVEISGGDADGMILALRGAPRLPLLRETASSLPVWTLDPALGPLETRQETLIAVGWSEDSRRWVYSSATRRS